MSAYRLKIPTIFLGFLLLLTLLNVFTTYRLRQKVLRLPADPMPVQTLEKFSAKLDGISDPAQLREIAAKEHRRLLAGASIVQSYGSLLNTISRAPLFSAICLLVVTLCYYLFEYRTPR